MKNIAGSVMPSRTKTVWVSVVAVIVAAWFASFLVGFMHESGAIEALGGEMMNPLIHTTRDLLLVLPVAVPIVAIVTYALGKD